MALSWKGSVPKRYRRFKSCHFRASRSRTGQGIGLDPMHYVGSNPTRGTTANKAERLTCALLIGVGISQRQAQETGQCPIIPIGREQRLKPVA